MPVSENPARSPSDPSGLGALLAPYEALVCDIWGVVHNGVAPYQGAAEALRRARAEGRRVLLVSNAPRPRAAIIAQLDEIGVSRDSYDDVVTSGDATRAAVRSGRFGRRFYHLGPERDRSLFEDLDLVQTEAENCHFVLCTGLFDDVHETPEDYDALLRDLRARDLPFVCANPDEVVVRGEERVYCAGALAKLYADLGGPVHLFGKPHRPIYDLCRQRIAALSGREVPPEAVLCIGDSLSTDVAGANRAGMDALFIVGGIHAEEFASPSASGPDRAKIDRICAQAGLRVTEVLERLVW